MKSSLLPCKVIQGGIYDRLQRTLKAKVKLKLLLVEKFKEGGPLYTDSDNLLVTGAQPVDHPGPRDAPASAEPS